MRERFFAAAQNDMVGRGLEARHDGRGGRFFAAAQNGMGVKRTKAIHNDVRGEILRCGSE
jgi:hypothetical protein